MSPNSVAALLAIALAVVAPPALAVAPPVNLRAVAQGLSLPLAITHAGDRSGRLFIVEKGGRVRILKDGVLLPAPFLDITARVAASGERGLLGLAFHPDYRANRRFFVFYTRNPDGALRVASFVAAAGNPDLADPLSEQEILTIPHPSADNHNGGQVAFGPDGYLYVSTGDGGGAGDANNNAQSLASRLGKILRIDVSGATGYTVPSTNPFVAGAAPEIWAYGLRNPWRFSFDRATGDLFIADVGQDTIEELNVQPAGSPGGRNYGWHVFEGNRCFNPGVNCSLANHTPPVLTYDHGATGGQSITGGYVYRGTRSKALQGYYIYGDFVSNRVWAARREANGWTNDLIVTPPSGLSGVSAFGEDEAGELYVASYQNGRVFALDAPATARLDSGVLSGLYWNPGESGWGLQLTQRGDAIFATIYNYDASGGPKWYVASNCARATPPVPTVSRCVGDLLEVRGPRYFGVPFDPSAVVATPVGTLEVNLENSERGTTRYNVGGITRNVAIQRQVFRGRSVALAVDYTDLWWNPAESGWGLTVSHQADVMFLTWYVYDDAGRPAWYVASNCAVNAAGSGCSGPLYRTTGPPLAAGFDPSRVQVIAVGTATLAFSGADNGVLSYTVDGRAGSKTITRQIF